MKTNCKHYNDLTICSGNDVVELREDYCITNLFKNKVGNCTQINNEHVPTVEEIGSDILLLNQFRGIITANGEEIKLNGTYLVKYFNVTININGEDYFSRVTSGSKPLPAALQPKAISAKTEEVLSLERLQKLNTGNVKRMDMLETKNNVLTVTSICAIISVIVLIIWILIKKRSRNKTNEADQTKIRPTEQIELSKTKPTQEKKQTSIYNLHTF